MTGNNGDGGSGIPMGHRDARAQGRRQRRGDARNHLEWDAVSGQELGFLGAAAEQERIAAPQPDHHPALSGLTRQQLADVALPRFVPPYRFAHVDALGRRLHIRQHFLLDQAVIHHYVAALQQPGGLHGEQLGVAGAGAHEVHFSGTHD
jgi:hypothetical protein